MPRGLTFLLLSIAMLASVFSLVSCDNSIYMPENDTWMVQDMYFQTFDEAVTWLSSQGGSSRDIVSESRTISLMRDVSASENAGAIVVPSSFSGDLCIDFKGYGYWFGTQTQKFFEIDGGDNVQIVNQKSVIPADSGSSAKAIVVNNANVTIEGLPVDDRRPEPKAVEIGSEGSLVLKTSVSGDFVIGGNGSLSIVSGEVRIGEFSMLEGATLSIEGGTVYYPHEASEAVTEAVASSGATDVTLVTVHDITGWITTDPVVHYTECSDCHIRFEEARHVFSAWTYDPDLHQSIRVCSVCGRTETLDHEHTVVLHEAVAKTCTADGSTEYWYCPVCNLMFSDSEGVYEITAADVRIPASHNLTHVDASATTCTVDGRVEHWLCLDCGKTFTDQSAETECTGVVIPAAHQLVHHAPVAATCTEDGSVEYWSCSVCGKLFSDTLGQHEITASDLVVAKKGHSPIKREAVSPTCTTAGNTAYWVCNVYGKLFSDEACTNEITYAETVVPALTHDVLHVPAVGATCTTAGNLEYWTCTRCGESFADSACSVSFDPSAAVIPAKGHSIVHVAAVAATCTSSGNLEYWKCTVCGKLFSDNLYSVEISIGDTVVAKKDHRLSHTAAVEPTCLSAGNIEYWTCLDCGKRFADQACTQEKTASELVIPASDHVLVHTAAVEPTCTASGNKEYWTCSECGHVFSDAGAQNMIAPYTVVLPKKGHSPVHTASLAPTCTASGNLEYWTCSECGKHFLDESCTQEVSAQALVLPATGHDVRHVSAIAATCTSEGRIEYWYCTVCGSLWSDEGLLHYISEAETVVAKLGHSLEHHAAVEAGCTTAGNIEYWSCTVCGKLFGDAQGISEISPASTVIAAKGHNPQTYVEPVAATCETDGNTGYWICSECGGLFSDAQCLNQVTLSDVTLTKTGHNAQHVDAVSATCTTAGNIEYWKCLRCGSLFSDSSCTQKITLAQTIIPTLNHSFNHVEGVPATCTSAGTAEHWHCTVCGKDYADSNGTVELDAVVIGALGHLPEHHEAVAHTCTTDGNYEYWYCTRCGHYFSDSACTDEITAGETVDPGLGGHDFGAWHYDAQSGLQVRECSVCGFRETQAHVHTLDHDDAVPATCLEDGVVEYWHCSECGKNFSNSEGTIQIQNLVAPALGHSLEHHVAVAHTCTLDGNYEYWYCTRCGKYFSNAGATTEITLEATVDHKSGHSLSDWVSTDSEVHYKVCSNCGEHLEEAEHSFGAWHYDEDSGLQERVCSVCGYESTKPHVHVLQFHAAVPHTCTTNGTIAYYECTECGRLFKDEGQTIELLSVVDPAAHSLVYNDAVAATCNATGNVEYWHCTVCEKNFSDSNGTNELQTVVTAPLGHSLEHHVAIAPTCTKDGNIEYWICTRCGKYFSNSTGTAEITLQQTVDHATGHQPSAWVITDAVSHYKVCSICEAHLEEAEHTFGGWHYDDVRDVQANECTVCHRVVTKAHTHDSTTYHAAVAHTCTTNGTVAYYECDECGRRFSDAACTNELVSIVDPASHSLVHNDAVAATCTSAGNVEYWHCTVCGKNFDDSSATHELDSVVVAALGHSLEHHAAVAHTCTEDGNIEYWYCTRCGKYFSNSTGTAEISLQQTVDHATGHNPSAWITTDAATHYKVCTVCGTHLEEAEHIFGGWHYDSVRDVQANECTVCHRVVTKAHTHDSTTYHAAVAHTCTTNGTVAYYECDECGRRFSDAACTIELASIVDPASHSLVHNDAVEATCTTAGNVEYWHCTVCGKNFSDSNGTNELQTVVIAALGHSLEHHAAVAHTCTEDGNIEYWYCTRCGKYFSNSTGTAEITLQQTVDPASGHNPSAWVTTDAATHYKVCTVCGAHLEEAEHTFGGWHYDDVHDVQANECTVCHRIIEKTHAHVLAFHAAVPHTCTADGTVAYYECTECSRHFSDEACTIELANIVDPASHSLVHNDAVAATCTTAGNVEYWLCTVCGKNYSDSAAANELNAVVTAALGHDLEHHAAVAHTCTEDGNIEYWFCTRCGKYFSNSTGTVEITQQQTVDPASGHSLSAWVNTNPDNHYKVCANCGGHLEEAEHSFGAWHYDEQSGLQVRVCSVCGYEATKPHVHVLQYHAAVPHTCTVNGTIAYYECTECGRLFKDEGQTIELASIVDPASHALEHVDEILSTCTVAGNVEYWHCSVCGKNFDDSSATHELDSVVVAALGHSLEHHAAVAHTCTLDGNYEYWYCTRCGKYFSNAGATVEISAEAIVDHATGHSLSDWVSTDSEVHYKVCSNCGEHLEEAEHSFGAWHYDEDSGLQERVCSVCGYESTKPHVHVLQYHAAVLHTCTTNGTIAYYECTECGRLFKDEGQTIELLSIVDPAAHSLVHNDAVAATCTAAGNVEYWHCTVCDKNFSDSNGTNELQSVVTAPLGHSLEHHVAVAPTCTKDGNIEYWYCTRCGKYFSNAGATVEITAEAIVEHATGHSPSAWVNTDAATHYKVCTICEAHLEEAEHTFGGWHYDSVHDVQANECTVCHRVVTKAHTHDSTTYHAAVVHTCVADGTVAYYECDECGRRFSDAACTKELVSIVDPAAHALVHNAAVSATCTSAGNVEYWHCSVCGKNFSDSAATHELDSVVIAALGHDLEHHAAVAHTCTEDGNIEYWYCTRCGKYFSDQACTVEITAGQAIDPSAGGHSFNAWHYDAQSGLQVRTCTVCGHEETKAHEHVLQYHAAVAHTCLVDGTIAHYKCTECEKMFSDANGTIELASVTDPASHTLVHNDAVAATCVSEGNVEYWHCNVCGKNFSDGLGTNELQTVVVARLQHDLTHHAALSATCTEDGNIEYWECSSCHGLFADAQATMPLQGSPVLEHYGHSLVHHAAVAATCTSTGNIEYWHCTVCGALFSDAQGVNAIQSPVVPKIAHAAEHIPATEATCTSEGNTEYWRCTSCGTLFSDSACTHEIILSDTVIPVKAHNAVMTEARAATCTEAGNIRYWTCTSCSRVFTDAECTNEVNPSSVVVPATGHTLSHVNGTAATCTATGILEHWHCTVCGLDFSDSNGNQVLASCVVPMVAHTLTHHNAVAPTCTQDGTVEYWSCSVCSGLFADEACSVELTANLLVIHALGHDLVHVQRVEPTCTQSGNAEYWYCSRCGSVFSDMSGLHEIEIGDTVLAARGHSATGTPAAAATCTTAGNTAYWYCQTCGHYFSDSACTHEIAEESWIIPATGHSLAHVSAVAATCTASGNVEHWHCSVCGKNYSSSDGTGELVSVTVPATGHSPVVTAAKAATCTENGNTIYWTCSTCGKYFSDERCQTEIAEGSWIIPATGHSLSEVQAQAATCTDAGMIAHWHCSECGRDFSDSQSVNEIVGSVVIPALGHSTVSTSAVAPTCTEAGNSAYWTCSRCGKHYSDAACTHEIEEGSWVIPSTGHLIVEVPAAAATCTVDGNVRYWRCSRCSACYSDAQGTQQIDPASVIIPATGHTESYNFNATQHWMECETCHATHDYGNHTWGEQEVCQDGHHLIRRCTVCGAIRNEDVEAYTQVGGGQITVLVPNAESSPCGTLKITMEGRACTVQFVPNINSNLNYSTSCRYISNGHWSDYLVNNGQDTYTFITDGHSSYKISLQAYNSGGTSVYEVYVN